MFDLPQLIQNVLEEFPEQSSTQWLSSALFWASSRNCEEAVRSLLEFGRLSIASHAHQAPLAAAAQGGFEGICDLLLAAAEIDPNQTNSQGKSALTVAAEVNHAHILRQILRHKAIVIDQVNADGWSAFMTAARSGSLEYVQALCRDGRADFNKADNRGQTALLHASYAGHLSVVRELLSVTGVLTNQTDSSGRNAISLASQQGHTEVVRQLFKCGFNPASRDICGRNSISWAANSQKATATVYGKESTLEYLVRKAGHACDEPDCDGWTPLAWALDTPGYLRSVEVLLRSSWVNIGQRDQGGRCPLHWAASAGMTEIVRCLLKRPDVNVNATSHGGRTPLFSAATGGATDVVKLLLQHPGIDTVHTDHSGKTAADWVRLNNHFEVASLLESRS